MSLQLEQGVIVVTIQQQTGVFNNLLQPAFLFQLLAEVLAKLMQHGTKFFPHTISIYGIKDSPGRPLLRSECFCSRRRLGDLLPSGLAPSVNRELHLPAWSIH
jgi:hypothetical protein